MSDPIKPTSRIDALKFALRVEEICEDFSQMKLPIIIGNSHGEEHRILPETDSYLMSCRVSIASALNTDQGDSIWNSNLRETLKKYLTANPNSKIELLGGRHADRDKIVIDTGDKIRIGMEVTDTPQALKGLFHFIKSTFVSNEE